MQDHHAPATDSLAAFRASLASVQAVAATIEAQVGEALEVTETSFDLAPLDDEPSDTVGESAHPGAASLVAALDALQTELQQAADSLAHLDEATSALEHLVPLVAHLTHTVAGADEAHDQLEEKQQAVVDKAETFTSSITDRHDTGTSEAFSNALHLLSDKLTHDFDAAVDDLNDTTMKKLDDFLSHSSSAGDELSDLWESLLHDAAAEIGETLGQELNNAFRDVVNQGVELLAKEVGGAFTSMLAGEATTKAMMPIIPHLIAAKAALKVLNFLKGLFD